MRFDIVSAVPELLESPFSHSILRRAIDKGLIEIGLHDLRKYGLGKYKQIDDYQYGGGAGMVMMIEPIYHCFKALQADRSYDEVIFFSPDGQKLDQSLVNKLSLKENLLLLCGHYKGVDQRVRDHLVTMEVSIGDYVLSGGELPAAVLVDAVARVLPGVIGDETSALFDSFQDGLLGPPVYTRPEEFEGWKVPGILRSGHQKRIEDWRQLQAIERTRKLRPDLLEEE